MLEDKKLSEYNNYLIDRRDDINGLKISEIINHLKSFSDSEECTFSDIGTFIYDMVRHENKRDREYKTIIWYLYNLCCLFIRYTNDEEWMLYKTLN